MARQKRTKKKFYCLDMFPYPSGAGLHVGHPLGYIATDIYSRFMRMNGYDVLHPMGWDAFGLPTENYAIKTGVHPKKATRENIVRFKKQLKLLNLSYNWDREVNTSDPSYYKWTQWFFLLMYKHDLAYQKEAPVNWCESCKTVLANEQVMDGKCERCKNDVMQKKLKQWFFRVTKYADRLLADLEKLDWPDKIKHLQGNWIGKSEGININFGIKGSNKLLKVFTKYPETVFGVTFMVVAPEHEIIEAFKSQITNSTEVKDYINKTKNKTERERISEDKNKSGVELKGIKAINPINNKEIPIWAGDFVLANFGTGAVMAVPAHDTRDFEFAKKYHLSIIRVEKSSEGDQCPINSVNKVIDDGIMINSELLNGLKARTKAKKKIEDYIEAKKFGERKTEYKMRDWLISRQRYWGAPIPIIYCNNCGTVSVPEKDLPVELPDDVDFRPKGKSPLASSISFTNVVCPKCGGKAQRETDTMDGFVDNSWYYYRYCDPKNNKEFASRKNIEKWLPVDLYVGGAEHAVGHLLYSRFFTKVLFDLKYINFGEPFKKLINQGMILGPDSRKMSKSFGNVINPDEIIKKYGADTLRMYEMFMGPLEDTKPWDIMGINGIKRFLDKTEIIIDEPHQKDGDDSLLHKTIKKVTDNIRCLRYNTAISEMMIYINNCQNKKTLINNETKEKFLIILAPFAPSLCEKLWKKIGRSKSIFLEQWPKYNSTKVTDTNITIVVQINGKVRDKIVVDKNISEKEALKKALNLPKVAKYIPDKSKIKKTIYITGKILSLVI